MKLNCAHPLRAWYFLVSLGSRIPATAPVQPWVNQGMPEISLSSRAVKGVLTVIENEMCVVVFFCVVFCRIVHFEANAKWSKFGASIFAGCTTRGPRQGRWFNSCTQLILSWCHGRRNMTSYGFCVFRLDCVLDLCCEIDQINKCNFWVVLKDFC